MEQAKQLFDAVEHGAETGETPSDMTILISPTGEIQMLAECDWPLESLQAHRGAGMVFRISQRGDALRLEGRAGTRTCLFETAKPDGAVRSPLADRPEDLLRPVFLSPGLAGVNSSRLLPAARH